MRFHAVLRLLVAALILAATSWTYGALWRVNGAAPNPANFFGFFTVQSNLIGAAVLVALGVLELRGRAQPGWLPLARGCATVYLMIVGLVYGALLAPLGEEGGVPVVWANTVLHVISPLFLPLDWVLVRDRPALRWRALPWVLAYPALWLVVVLLRGATDGWVPYPFLDPSIGYGMVALVSVAIFAVGLGLGALVWCVSRALPAREPGTIGQRIGHGHP